jgi:two-component system phosphate regulon response regulator PhoB
MRVLIVDPDPELTQRVAQRLRSDSIRAVEVLASLRAAIAVVDERPPDVVVCELDLPDGEGLELCRAIRRRPGGLRTAVLFLTGRSDEEAAVSAFRSGADDFVAKQGLSVRELSLRIRALRRIPPAPHPAHDDRVLQLGPLRIETETGTAWLQGDPVALTQLEIRLLRALASRPGRVLSRSQLLDGVWGGDSLQERTVDSAVKRLRARIGEAGDWIETVRGVGYRTRTAERE